MNIEQRRRAVLYRQGWTDEQITWRRIVTTWKLVGLGVSTMLVMVPAENWSNAGIVGVCWAMAALFIGLNKRV